VSFLRISREFILGEFSQDKQGFRSVSFLRISMDFILGEFSQDKRGVHNWLGVHSVRLHTRMRVDKNASIHDVEHAISRQDVIILFLVQKLVYAQ
jgi:hypothetical protein